MTRTLALLLALACATAAGCTVLTTRYDHLLPAEQEAVSSGQGYRETLAALGPPARIGRAGSGFAFLYEPLSTREDQLGFSLGGHMFRFLGLSGIFQWIKIAFARGSAQREVLLVVFGPGGEARSSTFQQRRENLGASSTMQLLTTIQSAIDMTHLEQGADPNAWGRQMLEPLPQALNAASALGQGAHGLEQRGTTDKVGQHALELRQR